MRRRAVLVGIGAAGGAAAALAWPEWLRRAFAGGEVEGGETCDITRDPAAVPTANDKLDLAGAARRAKATGRRVLVLVIPASDDHKWEQGHVFGEYLNNATDAELAPLARAEVVCATVAEVHKLAPPNGPPPATADEPLLFVVHPGATPVTAQAFDATIPPLGEWDPSLAPGAQTLTDDEKVQKRVAIMAGLVRRAVGPTDPAVAARDAAIVRKSVVEKPPTGTRWARSRGCGVNIEGEPPAMVGCGMGHVPAKSERFLYFFSDGTTI